MKEAGEVLDRARHAAGMEAKQIADDMDISQSLVLRGLKGVDHLSFHRLWMLSDAFWLELIVLAIERRGMAEVRRLITIDANRKVG
jgi:transcriptional regulator with XRE-family HTH domain